MKILIIEDESASARKLIAMVKQIMPHAQIDGPLDSIEYSLNYLKQSEPDLILSDIELSDGKCFELFEKYIPQCPVIFTTAYDSFAIQAFSVNSVDYLLKPIQEEKLKAALEKAEKRLIPHITIADIHRLVSQKHTHQKKFLFKQGSRLIPLNDNHIAYFFAEDKLVYACTFEGKKYIYDESLDLLERNLDPELFFRTGRGFLVNIQAIGTIHSWFHGKLKLTLEPDPGQEVMVSREKANTFKTWLSKS